MAALELTRGRRDKRRFRNEREPERGKTVLRKIRFEVKKKKKKALSIVGVGNRKKLGH